MAMQEARFSAAADAFVNGGIIVPEFQTEILDLLRRQGVLGRKLNYVPATGSPSRWFEQTARTAGAFSDKQALTSAATSPTRVEKSLAMKALTGRITYGLFDQETVKQQGQFEYLKAKDLKDMLTGIITTHEKALWNGSDDVAGAQVGAGTTLEYVGLHKQITKAATQVAIGASIVDAIRLDVAKLVADTDSVYKPTAVYVNPMLAFLIEQEMKQDSANTINKVEVVAGVVCNTIMTAAGPLPIVADPYLSNNLLGGAPTAGNTHYTYVILQEELLEYHFIGSQGPRLFQLGTTANLIEDYVGVMFGAPVLKAGDRAHVKGYVVRPTL